MPYNVDMIGKNDDRGRIIFVVIFVFAMLGKFIPYFVSYSRAQVQSALAAALVPVVLWVFWSLRHPLPSPGFEDGESASSEVQEAEIN